jgi:hypothetical protein
VGKHVAYAYKLIGDIDTPMIARILQPIWATKQGSLVEIKGYFEIV